MNYILYKNGKIIATKSPHSASDEIELGATLLTMEEVLDLPLAFLVKSTEEEK